MPERMLLVTGTPAEGFRFIGPITPNDPALDDYVDTQLRQEYWWYVPFETLDDARRTDDDVEPYGHCDTCGSPCNADGCATNREHAAAIDERRRKVVVHSWASEGSGGFYWAELTDVARLLEEARKDVDENYFDVKFFTAEVPADLMGQQLTDWIEYNLELL